MDEKQSSNFATGFLIGLLLCVILWYWQKSTAAEDGALELLERYATQEREWRGKEQMEETAVSIPSLPPPLPTPEPSFDFTAIKGVGAVFNQRLHNANITTLTQLLAIPVDTLAEILDIGASRAQTILTNAQIA